MTKVTPASKAAHLDLIEQCFQTPWLAYFMHHRTEDRRTSRTAQERRGNAPEAFHDASDRQDSPLP